MIEALIVGLVLLILAALSEWLFPYVLHIRRDEIHGWRWWVTRKDGEG
jgi:hypothetical protein